MSERILEFFYRIDSIFWGHIAFVFIMALGLVLTFRMRFFQFYSLFKFVKIFTHFLGSSTKNVRGVHPLKVFFASVGGMIGIGNIVGIITALQLGGPGALFWVWMAALFGSIIKYAEIYLGLKYRVVNAKGHYDGGPMYFLKVAFNKTWIPVVVAVLLCIYGVEIFQFTVLSNCLSCNWHIHRFIVLPLLLGMVLFAGLGGVRRIGKICSFLMPFFVVIYVSMILWIVFKEVHLFPSLISTIVTSAFSGHAAIGGFVGSSALLAIQQGIARAAYSADIGIGYDSIIQSESTTVHPEKQASLAILGVFLDNLICTLSIFVVLITGLWMANPPIDSSELVQGSLALYFPFMHFFIPVFLFISGYTTISAYFCVGLKCSRFLSAKRGEIIYVIYACAAFFFFSFFNQSIALLVMSICGSLLLMFNLMGIFRLRKEILLPADLSKIPSEELISINLERNLNTKDD